MPWILRRVAVGAGLPVDRLDLLLYSTAQASLAGALLLSAACALASRAARPVFAALTANAALHLLLDACEVKWGNGVHLLAPFSWQMTRFDLVSLESLGGALLTLLGLGVAGWELSRPAARIPFSRGRRRLAAAAVLVVAYLGAPLLALGAVEASGGGPVRVLRDVEGRTGRELELDRTHYRDRPAGDAIELWTGERIRVAGDPLDHDARVSLRGVFVGPRLLRIEAMVEHRVNRDWPTYAGIALLAALWVRSRPGPGPPGSPSQRPPKATLTRA